MRTIASASRKRPAIAPHRPYQCRPSKFSLPKSLSVGCSVIVGSQPLYLKMGSTTDFAVGVSAAGALGTRGPGLVRRPVHNRLLCSWVLMARPRPVDLLKLSVPVEK